MSDPTHTPVTDATVTSARILRDAAAYLVEHGWCRSGEVAYPVVVGRPVDALLAIAAVVFGPLGDRERLSPVEYLILGFEVAVAEWALAAFMLRHGFIVSTDPDESDAVELVWDWNDCSDRRADQVIAVIREAADACEATGRDGAR